MEYIAKKVEYLRGYADALEISDNTAEGKVLKQIISVLEEMASEIDSVVNDSADMKEQIGDIFEILADESYDGDEDYDNDDFDPEDSCDEDGEDIDYFEIQCPNCKEDVLIDYDMIDEDNSIVCPNCHREIELICDCGCDDDDDCCDCGDDE